MEDLVKDFMCTFTKLEPINSVTLKLKFEGSEGSIETNMDKNVQRYMVALLNLTPLVSNQIKEVTELLNNQLHILVTHRNNSEEFFKASKKTELGMKIWIELEKKLL